MKKEEFMNKKIIISQWTEKLDPIRLFYRKMGYVIEESLQSSDMILVAKSGKKILAAGRIFKTEHFNIVDDIQMSIAHENMGFVEELRDEIGTRLARESFLITRLRHADFYVPIMFRRISEYRAPAILVQRICRRREKHRDEEFTIMRRMPCYC
ncbi:MAG: hypothetical protein A3H57_03215 [Candidatus Taylorbacteria bacterium RIFCSPLOWO2_02_FULL_43_11]|uniref:Uncharacterized protein n=1 Tax=Candidatus Taylorbacteria bacterium RIFCSPHIGHO2_02_FULL_43_32b TaxID=1802306 RepID=A0A1G2MG41_9BACT|nr:MAG: hypothetical protein A2743_00865 [Candidatus Taylorbacteria bacterium RIFCSPHIGHO2_01_FULL_43_47]OHA22674.1 MAG: hypothetical protein A3C72_01290 [Candidatus Taylorbacteria bacterium RIFCSPHIGHO2_02_FULL_43_32b]OHA29634.1 MAG: hypothetical protein A3B08_03395 [Candidatus Taylorbacteria bacterium RIFCSPLOWO2_01_FULL_43_44]OHA36115.1 MAG: hypothetical protein A3H57_03215 [Candidatus Taylorbacteria bacterium RIFCSPLOWO2_02_FULL_43_11]